MNENIGESENDFFPEYNTEIIVLKVPTPNI